MEYILRNVMVGNFVPVQTSECTYTSLDGIAYYTLRLHLWYSLLLFGYKSI